MEFKRFSFGLSILSMAIVGSPSKVLVENNAKFAAHFSQLLKRQNDHKNFVFSPISIEMLFATMWTGLGGNTSEQVKKHIFHCKDSDRNCVHAYVLNLRKLSEGVDDTRIMFKFVPVLAVNKNIRVKDEFRQKLESFPSAHFLEVDFEKNASGTAEQINDIVAEKTENLIKNLIESGSLTAKTVMLLVNALYLNAWFAEPFLTENTQNDILFESETELHEVEFLHDKSRHLSYHKSGSFSMIGQEMFDKRFTFYIAMQEFGHKIDIDDVIRRKFNGEIKFETMKVDVKIPKFTMEHTVEDVVDQLKVLHVTDIFDMSKADFNGMLEEHGNRVAISDIRHKAFFEISNVGIRAAAAVKAGLAFHSFSFPAKAMFHANRPFAFFVTMKDDMFESVLFAGQYYKPPIK